MRFASTSIALILVASAALAGDPGDSTLLSMRLGIGARSGAMGEAGAASVTDATAIYWNPGGLAHVEGTDLSLQHLEYLGLWRSESLALAHGTEVGTFGLLVSGFYSDELERTDESPAGVSLGTFQPYDFVAGVGYGRAIGDLGLGATVKMVYSRIDVKDGRGFAFDAGALLRTKVEGLQLGLAASHMGADFQLDDGQKDPLPTLVRGGFAYAPPLISERGWGAATLAADVVLPNDGNGRVHSGLEYRLHEYFAVRLGQRFNYESKGFSFGAGFARKDLRVDYAFQESKNDLDSTHLISLSIALR